MSKFTLLHVINSLCVGGAEVLLANTIQRLPGYNHIVVTLTPEADLLSAIRPNLDAYYCLNAMSVSSWPWGVLKLRQIIHRHRPKLVHAHLQIAGLLAKAACPRDTPLFYSLHNPYSVDAFRLNRFALPLERLTARSRHHLIGVSRLALEDYQQHVPHSGTGDVVYNMVGDGFFIDSQRTAYEAGKLLRCVSVGNLKAQKNYLFSLQAFALLKDVSVLLDIYGDGAEEEMLAAVIKSENLGNVRLMGKSDRIQDVLPAYDLYLISSSYEGFGIAPLEAMASGLPALVSDIPVFREVMGEAALFFDLSSPQHLASMLRKIVAGEIRIDSIANAGREQARLIAHPDNYIRSLLNIYEKYI